ncbi:MAG: hypothetical protein ACRCUY_01535 [Thermoguttaceae bacterium]
MTRHVRKGREINSALCRKGFIRHEDGDHIRYFLFTKTGERRIASTKISHGMMGTTLSPKLVSVMAMQLHLSKDDFLALIDCTISESDYRNKLNEK